MNQTDQILAYLRRGRSLTPLSALNLFGCLRLGARVHDLKRQGVKIKTQMVSLSSSKRVAQYSL
jgi:hypothetical protein